MGFYFAVIVLITNEYRHRHHHTIALETENLNLNQKYLKYMLAFSPLICILSLSLLVLAWKALKLLDEKYNFHVEKNSGYTFSLQWQHYSYADADLTTWGTWSSGSPFTFS